MHKVVRRVLATVKHMQEPEKRKKALALAQLCKLTPQQCKQMIKAIEHQERKKEKEHG